MPIHKGGCHCGVVSFEFTAPAQVPMTLCNCSICALTAYQHIFAEEKHFRLLSGADDLTRYQFGSKAASHLFCRHCGVKAFYRPRSHPDKYSVNYRAVAAGTLSISETINFDGQNWEDNVEALRAKTT